MESIDIIILCKDEEENIEHIYSEIMKLEPEVKCEERQYKYIISLNPNKQNMKPKFR